MDPTNRPARCDRCAIALPADWGACPLCGETLRTGGPMTVVTRPELAAGPAGDPAAGPPADEPWECMVCTSPVPPTADRCPICGTVFDSGTFAREAEERMISSRHAPGRSGIEKVRSQTGFIAPCRCPLCWTTLACSTGTCPACGTVFEMGSGGRSPVHRLA